MLVCEILVSEIELEYGLGEKEDEAVNEVGNFVTEEEESPAEEDDKKGEANKHAKLLWLTLSKMDSRLRHPVDHPSLPLLDSLKLEDLERRVWKILEPASPFTWPLLY